MAPKLKLRQFSIAFKIKMIRYYESLQDGRPLKERSLGFVCKQSSIHRQSLTNWLKNKEILYEQISKFNRAKLNRSDRSECPHMEIKLKDWVIDNRQRGVCIDGAAIIAKGKQIYEEIHPLLPPIDFIPECHKPTKELKFSAGWLENFLRLNQNQQMQVTEQMPAGQLYSFYNSQILLLTCR